MKIRYTGTKPAKRVTIGLREYIFDPYCEFNEVFDINEVKWLLHTDRQGLFEVAEVYDETPSHIHPEATEVVKEKDQVETPKVNKLKKKRRKTR